MDFILFVFFLFGLFKFAESLVKLLIFKYTNVNIKESKEILYNKIKVASFSFGLMLYLYITLFGKNDSIFLILLFISSISISLFIEMTKRDKIDFFSEKSINLRD